MQTGNIFIEAGIVDPEGDPIEVLKLFNLRTKQPITHLYVLADGEGHTMLLDDKLGYVSGAKVTVWRNGDYVFDPGTLVDAADTTVSRVSAQVDYTDGKSADHQPDASLDRSLLLHFDVQGTRPANEAPAGPDEYAISYVADPA